MMARPHMPHPQAWGSLGQPPWLFVYKAPSLLETYFSPPSPPHPSAFFLDKGVENEARMSRRSV